MGMMKKKVNKVYLMSAFKFGLLYGVVFGLISSVVALIMGASFLSTVNFITSSVGWLGMILGALILFVGVVISSAVSVVIWALIYNLIAKLGGSIQVQMVDVVGDMGSGATGDNSGKSSMSPAQIAARQPYGSPAPAKKTQAKANAGNTAGKVAQNSKVVGKK